MRGCLLIKGTPAPPSATDAKRSVGVLAVGEEGCRVRLSRISTVGLKQRAEDDTIYE